VSDVVEERRIFLCPSGEEDELLVSREGPGVYRVQEFFGLLGLDLSEKAGFGWLLDVEELPDGRLSVQRIREDPAVEAVSGVGLPGGFSESAAFSGLADRIVAAGGNWELFAHGLFSAYVQKDPRGTPLVDISGELRKAIQHWSGSQAPPEEQTGQPSAPDAPQFTVDADADQRTPTSDGSTKSSDDSEQGIHEELSRRLATVARQATTSLLHGKVELPALPEDASTRVLVGFTFFHYHWTDRIAWSWLGARRNQLMDAVRDRLLNSLATQTATGSSRSSEEHAESVRALNFMLDDFQQEFANYSLPEPPVESPKGTLLWEFGAWLARALECPLDMRIVLGACALGVDGMREIDARTVIPQYDPLLGSVSDGKVVIPCQHCPQRLRVPQGLGKIRVACPRCKELQYYVT
jgi:hypothetical protein